MNKTRIWETLIFLKSAITWLKIMRVGGVLVFWTPQDLPLMMGTEIFNIDTSWAEKLMKTRVPFSTAPTVMMVFFHE